MWGRAEVPANAAAIRRVIDNPSVDSLERMLLSHGQVTDLFQKELSVSVVTALTLVLFVGFVVTGLIGFLGWRQRMREGARS